MGKMLPAERQYGPWLKGTKEKKTLFESSVLPQMYFVTQVHIPSVCLLPQPTFDAAEGSGTESPKRIIKSLHHKTVKDKESI